MRILDSCKTALSDAIKNEYFAAAHLYRDEKSMDIHIHDCYEIYYSISGGQQFLIDNRFYDFNPGDVFFINQYESHYLSKIDDSTHERIIIAVHPNFLKQHSTANTDLNYCFSYRDEVSGHCLSLSLEEQKRFMFYFNKLRNNNGYGSDILDVATFLELMTFLNQTYHLHNSADYSPDSLLNKSPVPDHSQIGAILSYINQNIANNLALEHLAQKFYISTSYLCRIFKNATGTTINKYITAKRIALAKNLLDEGNTAFDACTRCGFQDYSNFYKAFKKSMGVSPRKYGRFSQ